ncbi:General secretion pathway protein D precursor [Delftia tsuruhatensis]|uniref:type II secretion system secretin GspD n=1 Tax=Delftia tsuruhatensis TaxID=180282 RepID=UPI001E7932A8|nr:type II secretion system secretin GspD [Delftia tsuruhatensis]CAB5710363.1 General secretion pathway protein D precursor [Delftia tsuruhatensis]CAC9692131.1 General secretion pathway protein D precursor [Delftia tsuruhatensis]
MQLSNRPIRTALALAVCQLLLACAQPAKNNFVSHFGSDAAGGYVFLPEGDDGREDAKKKPATEADSPKPRILEGTGKLLGEAKPLPAVTGSPVKLNFEDAPLSQVVRTVLGDILSLDYVLHPPINGNITLSTRNAIPADQALNLLETALQANGMAMVRDARGTYHVGRVDALKSIGATVRQAAPDKPIAPGYGTIIVPLQYIGANEMASILRPMVPGDAIVRVDNIRNLLVMAGSRAQAEGWLDMVRTFDVNLLEGMSVGVFPLKYVSIQEVSSALQIMSGGGSGAAAPGAPGAAAGSARPGAAAGAAPAAGAGAGAVTALGEGNPMFGALRIIPIERLNSIIVITPRAAYLDEARRWLAKLDQPGSGGSQPQLNIYRVQNGNARHLASVLAGIFGGSTGGSTANSGVAPGLGTSTSGNSGFGNSGFGNSGFGNSGFGNSGFGNSGFGNSGFGNSGFGNSGFGNSGFGNSGFGSSTGQRFGSTTNSGFGGQTGTGQGMVGANLGSVRVMADELNNSVLVWGTPAEFERIEASLKKLDLPPTQVLIEASIVEVTLNDTLRYGLQWAFSGDVGNKGYSGNGGLLGQAGDQRPPGATSLDTATGGLGGLSLGQGFNYTLKNSLGNIKAVLTALAGKTQVKVVASPTLMVLDNHPAAIAVGTQQPYKSGTTVTGTSGTAIDNFSYKDTGVNLQVVPSVNAGNLVTMTVNQSVTDVGAMDEVTRQRAFLQRQISSRVAVRSGESIVMGGLIQENSNEGRSGIPYLYDLPVVGNLFGSTNNSGARTELIVIITPRVVRTDVDVREVSEDLREQMRSLSPLLKSSGRSVPEDVFPVPSKASVEVGPLTPASR